MKGVGGLGKNKNTGGGIVTKSLKHGIGCVAQCVWVVGVPSCSFGVWGVFLPNTVYFVAIPLKVWYI